MTAPGLKKVTRKSGTVVWYWQASIVSRKTDGFEPRTVRLTGTTDEERAARCRVLTAELKQWLAERGRDDRGYAGTIASLIRCYQRDEDSPYRAVKHNTRGDYDYGLAILENAVGRRLIEELTAKDVRRWYRNFRAPAEPGGPERIRRAHGAMKMLRIVAGYGKSMRYPGCRDLADVLSEMKFELPARREEALSFSQAEAIVRLALERGEVSMALAQALQFETALRQVDVIGQWERFDEGNHHIRRVDLGIQRDADTYPAPDRASQASGILDRGQRWSGGVLWSDVSPDLVLTKKTTKTAKRGEWDLRLCPLVMLVLPHVPQESRIGPMIVSEATGRPYRPNLYQKRWRALARACGVPDDVWNRDSRAGGITEALEAEADPRDVQNLATHADAKMTARYDRSTSLRSTSKVAELRVKARDKE